MQNDAIPSGFAMNDGLSQVNARAANAGHGLLQINAETPLWSFHDEDDFLRLSHGDGTPKHFTVGDASKGGGHVLNVRNNESVPLQPHEGSPLPNLKYAYHAHLEERLPGARMDPHVAAFRTSLGLYHGLETPTQDGGALVPVKHLGLIDESGNTLAVLPEGETPAAMWQQYQGQHLQEHSIPKKYVGELFDRETLAAVDARARAPHVVQFESSKYRWNPNVGPAETAMAGIPKSDETEIASSGRDVRPPWERSGSVEDSMPRSSFKTCFSQIAQVFLSGILTIPPKPLPVLKLLLVR